MVSEPVLVLQAFGAFELRCLLLVELAHFLSRFGNWSFRLRASLSFRLQLLVELDFDLVVFITSEEVITLND